VAKGRDDGACNPEMKAMWYYESLTVFIFRELVILGVIVNVGDTW
jgi:hypothetical protein